MRIAVFALNKKAAGLARRIRQVMEAVGNTVCLYISPRYANAGRAEIPIHGNFLLLVGSLFSSYDAMIFIMAAGIVVRSIAPFIKDKKTDPAVVVLDDKGQFVISLLSGHVGGANRLARFLADSLGAVPVITTASDVNGIIAIDELACSRGWEVENWDAIKEVSSALVNGGKTAFVIDRMHYLDGVSVPDNVDLLQLEPGNFNQAGYDAVVFVTSKKNIPVLSTPVLVLRPRTVIVGVGCRRGTAKDQIITAVNSGLDAANRSVLSVKCLATVDIKRDEEGLLKAARAIGLPLTLIPAEAIARIETRFSCSPLVKSRVGVGAVCEPAAYLAGTNPVPVLGKTGLHGVTIAVYEETGITPTSCRDQVKNE